MIESCALQPDIDMLPAGDSTEIGEKVHFICFQYHMDPAMRKSVFVGSHQVRHKLGSTASEDGFRLEICKFVI